MADRLLALAHIQVGFAQYKPGDFLPADRPEDTAAWIEAGTAMWVPEDYHPPSGVAARPVTAEPGLPGIAVGGELTGNAAQKMQSMTFKQVMDRDVDETFLNVAEFADLHNIDGNNVPALIDDMENIEREKRMKSNMDGIHARQVLLYVKASVFPNGLPAQKRLIKLDGKMYTVVDSTDEGGVYTITLEANRSR